MHLSVKIRVHPCPAFASPHHTINGQDLLDALHWFQPVFSIALCGGNWIDN